MKINPTELRRSFNGGNPKISKNLTISTDAWNRVSELVPTGHGKYGSTFLDRAARLFLFILNPASEDLEENQIYDMLRHILQDNDSVMLQRAARRAHWIYNCLHRISQATYWTHGDPPFEP